MAPIGLWHAFWSSILTIGVSTVALAQETRFERIDLGAEGDLQILEDVINGYETVDYAITVDRSQIISVDLQTQNPSANFNVVPEGKSDAIFIGSTQGKVADVPAPSDGDYLIRVYLMRSAARRGESAEYALSVSVGAPEFADGLFGGPDYWRVVGLADGSLLNLRSGPSTRYQVIGKLINGDVLENRGCRLTGTERWCRIREMGSGLIGWVAGRFIAETAPPTPPWVSGSGPVGNGGPFDATGFLACAIAADQQMQQCPFGVVRSGIGNAGVWISLGVGSERHILFENGSPVTSNSPTDVRFEKRDDLYIVLIGDDTFEVPEAAIFGG